MKIVVNSVAFALNQGGLGGQVEVLRVCRKLVLLMRLIEGVAWFRDAV